MSTAASAAWLIVTHRTQRALVVKWPRIPNYTVGTKFSPTSAALKFRDSTGPAEMDEVCTGP